MITCANDPKTIFFLEISIDTVILFGILLSLYNKFIKWWLIPFLFSAVGEVYLLANDERIATKEAIQWVLILLPAVYLNLKVVGFIGNRKSKSQPV